jgi:hypothetical protein
MLPLKMNEIKRWIDKAEAFTEIALDEIENKTHVIEVKEKRLENLIKARWVLTEVVKQTQMKFKVYIESLVTELINAVFERDYKFILEYDVSRNKMTAQPLVQEKNYEPEIPKEEMGVSILDLISFAFRVVLWSIQKPQSRNVMWLDEPMRDIGKGDLLIRSGEIIKSISKKLGIQLIIITHEPDLAQIADRVFRIEHNGIHSVVYVDSNTDYLPPEKLKIRKRLI